MGFQYILVKLWGFGFVLLGHHLLLSSLQPTEHQGTMGTGMYALHSLTLRQSKDQILYARQCDKGCACQGSLTLAN